MYYTRHMPAYPLCEFVEFLWCLTEGPTHSAERILPGGTTELVINLHDNEIRIDDPMSRGGFCASPSSASGPYSHSFDIDASRHAAMLGVHFKLRWCSGTPGCAPARTPRHACRPRTTMGPRSRQVAHTGMRGSFRGRAIRHRRIRADVETPRRASVPPPGVATAVAALLPGTSLPPIGDLAERAGLSHRQFIRAIHHERGDGTEAVRPGVRAGSTWPRTASEPAGRHNGRNSLWSAVCRPGT